MLIWAFTDCLYHTKMTLGLYGLKVTDHLLKRPVTDGGQHLEHFVGA